MMQSPVSSSVSSALGAYLTHWNLLEKQLSFIAAAILGVDQFKARLILASFTSFKAQRDLIQGLGDTYLADDETKRLRRLLRRARKLSSCRNTLIHGLYGAHADKTKNTVFSDRIESEAGLAFQSHEISAEYIANRQKFVQILANDFVQFHVHLIAHPETVFASPKIHREQQKRNPT